MTYVLKILRPGTAKSAYQHEKIEIPLPGLETFLTPEEVFQMEFKLNELLQLRFHIEEKE